MKHKSLVIRELLAAQDNTDRGAKQTQSKFGKKNIFQSHNFLPHEEAH